MNGIREYCVIEFKDPLVMDQDRYICVPKPWVGRPFTEQTPHSDTVVVKYPLEKQSTTRLRVRRYEDYDDDWNFYIAFVKITTENYKDAMSYIRLLHKANEGPRPEHTNRSESNQSCNNTPRDKNQNKTRRTDTGLREPDPSEGQGSSTDTPTNKKSAPKKKYARKSQNNTNADNRTEQETVNENFSKCDAIAKDIETLKNDLFGFFNKFLPMVEKFETNLAQNTVMLEKILTILVEKTKRPNYETVPTVTKVAIENNGETSGIKTVDANNVADVVVFCADEPVATTSKNTKPVAAPMEVEVETTVRTEENTADGKTAEVETVNEVGSPQTGDVTKEDSRPVSKGIKRSLVDTDSNVPMKKRDGPRNPTLQNNENVWGILNSGRTQEQVESISGNNRELAILSHKYITFITDALKISSLYKKS